MFSKPYHDQGAMQRILRLVHQKWLPKMSSVQLFFIEIIGEYIGAIHTKVLKPLMVIEKEQINFGHPSCGPESSLHFLQV